MAGSSVPKLFAREATGLVRELGFWEQLVLALGIINITGGFVLTMIVAPFAFPGSNMIAVFALGAIPALVIAWVYSILSAAIPRTGGDYVWTGRVLGPEVASILGWMYIFGTAGAVASQAWYITNFTLAQLFFNLGTRLNNATYLKWATMISTAPLGFIVDLIIVILAALAGIFSLRTVSRILKYSIVIFGITFILFLISFIYATPQKFIPAFNAIMSKYGATYSSIMSVIKSNPSIASTSNIAATLLAAIPMGFITYSGFNYGTYLAGETRHPVETFPKALFVSVIITLVGLVLLSALSYWAFGGAFLGGLSYLFNTGKLSALPVEPTPNLFIGFTAPLWLVFLININLIIGFFLVALTYTLTMPRILFAMGFDRVLPEGITKVSEKFHSPYYTIIVYIVINAIYTALIWYWGYMVTWLNTSLGTPIAWAIPGFTALLFPFLRRDLYAKIEPYLPKWMTRRVLGLPAISWGGILLAAVWIADIAFLLIPISTYTYLGTSIPLAVGVAVAIAAGAVIYYEVRRWYLKKKYGIDILTLTFKEVPPE
ncbi:APC family permease [Caldivirga maquilingensis]|uniref:Amino acid permease-associated region n=1 Tax=Caldivirga maquilingensis (strain ATCC 700844 / DSM 13496 / JCM 10307 / IC-167) TaxID=397948 RepID=A8MD13_CALMQ|nr:APC family permease [Caldivirga maquilingensis]ABW01669.1 amino acid permease-associated region [Caldivirga maquilingensis IC-167]